MSAWSRLIKNARLSRFWLLIILSGLIAGWSVGWFGDAAEAGRLSLVAAATWLAVSLAAMLGGGLVITWRARRGDASPVLYWATLYVACLPAAFGAGPTLALLIMAGLHT